MKRPRGATGDWESELRKRNDGKLVAVMEDLMAGFGLALDWCVNPPGTVL